MIHSKKNIIKKFKNLPLFLSPGQVLQHLPGNKTGSSHKAGGHSFLILRHCTRATMRRFLGTCKKKEFINLVFFYDCLFSIKKRKSFS